MSRSLLDDLTRTMLRNHLETDTDDWIHEAGLVWARNAVQRLPIGRDDGDAIINVVKRAARYAIDLEQATTAEYGARR
jgi:hypothetical protein